MHKKSMNVIKAKKYAVILMLSALMGNNIFSVTSFGQEISKSSIEENDTSQSNPNKNDIEDNAVNLETECEDNKPSFAKIFVKTSEGGHIRINGADDEFGLNEGEKEIRNSGYIYVKTTDGKADLDYKIIPHEGYNVLKECFEHNNTKETSDGNNSFSFNVQSNDYDKVNGTLQVAFERGALKSGIVEVKDASGAKAKKLIEGKDYYVEVPNVSDEELKWNDTATSNDGRMKVNFDKLVDGENAVFHAVASKDYYFFVKDYEFDNSNLKVYKDHQAPKIIDVSYKINGSDAFINSESGENVIFADNDVTLFFTVEDMENNPTDIVTSEVLTSNSYEDYKLYNKAEFVSKENKKTTYKYTFSSGTTRVSGLNIIDEADNISSTEEIKDKLDCIIKIDKRQCTSSDVNWQVTSKDYELTDSNDEEIWFSRQSNDTDEPIKVKFEISHFFPVKSVVVKNKEGEEVFKKVNKPKDKRYFIRSLFGLDPWKYEYEFEIDSDKDLCEDYTVSFVPMNYSKKQIVCNQQIKVRIDNTNPVDEIRFEIPLGGELIGKKKDSGISEKNNTYFYLVTNQIEQNPVGYIWSKNRINIRVHARDAVVSNVKPSGVKYLQYNVNMEEKSGSPMVYPSGNIVEFDEEGNGVLSVSLEQEGRFFLDSLIITDKAGNKSSVMKDKIEYVLDAKAPRIEVSMVSDDRELAGQKESPAYTNKDVFVKANVEDLNFDNEAVSIKTLEGKWDAGKFLSYSRNGIVHTYDGTLLEDGRYQFSIKAIDLADNESDEVESPYVVIDKTLPKVEVTYSFGNKDFIPEGSDTTFLNQNVSLNVKFTEKNFDPKNTKVKIFYTDTEDKEQAPIIIDGSEFIGDEESGIYTASKVIEGEGKYHVEAYATDLALNAMEDYVGKEFVIDKSAPKITVEFDNNSAANEIYYKDNRVATITINEYTFDSSKAISMMEYNLGIPSQGTWEKVGTNTYKKTISFTQDGKYSFDVNCIDKAGNEAETMIVEDFWVDKTAPVVEVGFDNNDFKNEKYFNNKREAFITIDELTFEESLVDIKSKEGKSPLSLRDAFTKSDDVKNIEHKTSMKFENDGEYAFVIEVKDLAGNTSNIYENPEFVIDTTLPSVSFGGVEDHSANNKVVAPSLTYIDKNMDIKATTVIFEGSNNGKVNNDMEVKEIENGYEVKYADFPHIKEMDDMYTMTAKVVDLAGNEIEESLVFSVNRFGSVYILGDETKKIVNNYYTNDPKDVVITEINIDDLVEKDISVSRDGKLKKLKNGRHYEVKAEGSDKTWKSFTYTINAKEFGKDGVYCVSVYSTDRATNKQSNMTKDAEIDFAVDKTKPSIVVSNLHANGKYEEENHEITINVTDNMCIKDLSVFSNGKLLGKYNEEKIKEFFGTFELSIPKADVVQNISFKACDASGNIQSMGFEGIEIGDIEKIEKNKEAERIKSNASKKRFFVAKIKNIVDGGKNTDENSYTLLVSMIVILMSISILGIVVYAKSNIKKSE